MPGRMCPSWQHCRSRLRLPVNILLKEQLVPWYFQGVSLLPRALTVQLSGGICCSLQQFDTLLLRLRPLSSLVSAGAPSPATNWSLHGLCYRGSGCYLTGCVGGREHHTVVLRNSQICMLSAYGTTFAVVKGYLAHSVACLNKCFGTPKNQPGPETGHLGCTH